MIPRIVKSSSWHGGLLYVLIALALIAGLGLVQGTQVAADEPLTADFVVGKNWVQCGEDVTFDPTPTTGGTLPYTRARWDWEGDGVWDEDSDVTGKDPMAIVTHAYCQAGSYYPCLEVTDSSTPPVVSTTPITSDYAVAVGWFLAISWWLRYGLDADPAAINIWNYPDYATEYALADLDGLMPGGLLIWNYGGPGFGWRFYKKGWGDVNTLTTLIPGHGYIGIVPTESFWFIEYIPVCNVTKQVL